jgi:hypothetical protein
MSSEWLVLIDPSPNDTSGGELFLPVGGVTCRLSPPRKRGPRGTPCSSLCRAGPYRTRTRCGSVRTRSSGGRIWIQFSGPQPRQALEARVSLKCVVGISGLL